MLPKQKVNIKTWNNMKKTRTQKKQNSNSNIVNI